MSGGKGPRIDRESRTPKIAYDPVSYRRLLEMYPESPIYYDGPEEDLDGLQVPVLGPSNESIASRGGAATFSDPRERAIADYLEGLGRRVSKNPLEGTTGAGWQGDAFVDGVLHEFKTLYPGAGAGTITNAVNNSIRRGGQAREIVIDARGTGLLEDAAKQGAARALGVARGRLDGLTILGDGYFFRWMPR